MFRDNKVAIMIILLIYMFCAACDLDYMREMETLEQTQ